MSAAVSTVVLMVVLLSYFLQERTKATCWSSLAVYVLVEARCVVAGRIEVTGGQVCGGRSDGVVPCQRQRLGGEDAAVVKVV